jgi:hypothetical protein
VAIEKPEIEERDARGKERRSDERL